MVLLLFKDGPRGGLLLNAAILWDLPFNEKVSGWETHSENMRLCHLIIYLYDFCALKLSFVLLCTANLIANFRSYLSY